MDFFTKLNKRQEIILNHIIESKSLISIGNIFIFLQKNQSFHISRPTLSRDLGFLIENNILVSDGLGRSVKYKLSPVFSLFQEINIQSYFEQSQDDRIVKKNFNFDIFSLLASVDVFTKKEREYLDMLFEKYKDNIKKIKSETILKKEFERIIIEFSWKSSKIEGNTYSLLDTEELIKNNKSAEGKTINETQMILNHKSAFDFILENKNEFAELSCVKIEHIHSFLTKNLNISKNLRTIAVGIVGTNYVPLNNQFHIKEAVISFVNLINRKEDFFEKSLLSLVLLSYIQAFEDGNKRTARLISNAILLAYDSIPISYRAVSEVEYKKASILFYEQNNISYFKKIFIEQYEFAIKNYFC